MKPLFRKALAGAALLLCLAGSARAQQAQQRSLRPDPVTELKQVIDRIYNYLDGCTPAAVVDADGRVHSAKFLRR